MTARGKLQDLAESAGPVFRTGHAARGLASGDFDNDGDADALLVRLNQRPLLLRNNRGQDSTWIGFRLEGTRSNRDAIGARVEIDRGDRKSVRWLTGGGSFLASHDKRLIFGLGVAGPRSSGSHHPMAQRPATAPDRTENQSVPRRRGGRGLCGR